MVRVHIGVNLEDETCHLLLLWLDFACLRGRWAWRWSDADKALQQLAHTKVIYRRAEEYGGKLSCEVRLLVELIVDTLHQLHIVTQLLCIAVADK